MENNIRTEEVDGGWIISEDECWIDGVYATEDAAKYAALLDIEMLSNICKEHDYTKGDITLKELQNAK